jgi:hypothetical protein
MSGSVSPTRPRRTALAGAHTASTGPPRIIVSGPLTAHDYPTLLGAAIQGVGLAQVPGPLPEAPIADGRLQALLTPFAVTTPGVFLYHPGRRQVLPSCAHSSSTSNTGAAMHAAEPLRENCTRSTLQTLDLEAGSAHPSSRGRSFTTSRARVLPPPLRAFVGSSNSYTRDRSRPHPELSAPDGRNRRV